MGKIIIAGLGAGKAEEMSYKAYQCIFSDSEKYIRTKKHPAVSFFCENNISATYLDYIYEEKENLDDVYKEIISVLENKILEGKELIYFVPGSPFSGDRAAEYFMEKYSSETETADGKSLIDAALELSGWDGSKTIKIINTDEFDEMDIDINIDTLIGSIENQNAASAIKIELMEKYPAEYKVNFMDIYTGENEKIELFQLDRKKKYGFSRYIFIESVEKSHLQLYNVNNLIAIMRKLRGPEGCPWDIKQTHMSIRECILEEAYEVIDAIQNDDTENLIEELGDILLQVVFHSQIAREEGEFTIDDVAARICTKMIVRHPHVFGDAEADDAEQVIRNWEEIKNSEKSLEKISDKFSFIPKSMPPVIRSYEIQKIAAESGFDWPDEQGALLKIKEEIEELAEAYKDKEIEFIEEELGDLIFAIINFARFMKINPEISLNNTNEKFIKRFKYIEKNAEKNLDEMTLEEMDLLWEKSKGH